MVTWRAVLTDPRRLNTIASAILGGVEKVDFQIRSKDESEAWDALVLDIRAIRKAGHQVDLVNE